MKKIRLFILSALLMIVAGCSSTNPNDPFEGYNRFMYNTNKTIDKYTLRPLAKAYQAVTPDVAEKGISNFFDNISEIGTLINSLLQGKLHNAAVSSARIVWNTTLGLGGLLDVATKMDLVSEEEDFGQTLQTWGVPAGPFLVLPLLGPSTVTDSIGLVGDYFTNPINYNDYDETARISLGVMSVINTRTELFALEGAINNAPGDEYNFVREAYKQRRAFLVRDGAEDSSIDDEIDELLDEE